MTRQLTIVTGASAGIGAGIAATAQAGAADGSRLATLSRRPGPGTHLAADLSNPADWSRATEWVDDLVNDTYDRIVLIHNAGTVDPVGFAGEVDPAAYNANIVLNSASVQVIGNAFLQSTLTFDGPVVFMNISSGAGKRPFLGWSSYCAGKAAGDMWVQTAGIELGERRSATRVVSVSPGVVATDMQAAIRASDVDAFPNVEQFKTMFTDGQLADAGAVGAKLFALACRDDLPQGGVFGVNDEI